MTLGQIKWNKVEKLSSMPAWAVDKHTFRGKRGKGTKHIVKKKPSGKFQNDKIPSHNKLNCTVMRKHCNILTDN